MAVQYAPWAWKCTNAFCKPAHMTIRSMCAHLDVAKDECMKVSACCPLLHTVEQRWYIARSEKICRHYVLGLINIQPCRGYKPRICRNVHFHRCPSFSSGRDSKTNLQRWARATFFLVRNRNSATESKHFRNRNSATFKEKLVCNSAIRNHNFFWFSQLQVATLELNFRNFWHIFGRGIRSIYEEKKSEVKNLVQLSL